MTEIGKIKLTIPEILKAINQADDDESIARYSNMLACMFISPIMFATAFLNTVCILFFQRDIVLTIIDTAVFAMLGAAFEAAIRGRMKVRLMTHAVSALFSILFAYIMFRYYYLIGPALWTMGFILFIFAMSHIWRTMLIYISVTVWLSGVYITFFDKSPGFTMGGQYHILQFIFFTLLIIVSLAIRRINFIRIQRIKNQLKEVNLQIAERKKTEETNIRLSLYDQLTGLPNRAHFMERLSQALPHARRSGSQLYVAFVDLDYFKMISDTMGLAYGDELLKQVGKRLSDLFRNNDSVARVGGDEFLVLIQEVKSKRQAMSIAGNMLQKIGIPVIMNRSQMSVTGSIGISVFPGDGEDVEILVKNAGLALNKAKADGKNRYAFYSDNLKDVAQYEMGIISDMKKALLAGEFELYYQPQVNGTTNEIIGSEALIRWNHPTLGLVSPNEFIPHAEKTGLIVPIGEWVLRTACMQNKAWQAEGTAFLPVAVNLSARQFGTGSLTSVISKVLQETGLEPRYLEIEITERTLVQETEKIRQELNNIRKLGVKVAIDDFGTGYSSMQYLKQFPIDRIKIPGDFIRGIDNNTRDESIIAIIIALAENLGLDVIAEGVETEGQLNFLLARSCKHIQGYYYCKPKPAREIEACFKTNSKPGAAN